MVPTDISGLLLWLKADSLSLNDGDPVSTWADQSGNANDATQAGTLRPLYKTNIINGLPVVRGDGSNDYMPFTSTITTIRTAFFVFKHRTGNQEYAPLFGHLTLFHWHGGGVGQNDGTKLFGTSASVSVRNGAHYVNGGVVTPYSSLVKPTSFQIYDVVTTGNCAAQYITNDSSRAGGSRYWDGDFAEIILYNSALSDAQRQGIEQYLSAKYAITLTSQAQTVAEVAPPAESVSLTVEQTVGEQAPAAESVTVEVAAGVAEAAPAAESTSAAAEVPTSEVAPSAESVGAQGQAGVDELAPAAEQLGGTAQIEVADSAPAAAEIGAGAEVSTSESGPAEAALGLEVAETTGEAAPEGESAGVEDLGTDETEIDIQEVAPNAPQVSVTAAVSTAEAAPNSETLGKNNVTSLPGDVLRVGENAGSLTISSHFRPTLHVAPDDTTSKIRPR